MEYRAPPATIRPATRTATTTPGHFVPSRRSWPTPAIPAGWFGTVTAPTTTKPSPATSAPAIPNATSPTPKTIGSSPADQRTRRPAELEVSGPASAVRGEQRRHLGCRCLLGHVQGGASVAGQQVRIRAALKEQRDQMRARGPGGPVQRGRPGYLPLVRSEEHTSELQSH